MNLLDHPPFWELYLVLTIIVENHAPIFDALLAQLDAMLVESVMYHSLFVDCRPGMEASATSATYAPLGEDESLESFSQIKMISPMEMDLAFVRAAFFDLNDAIKMDECRTGFLTFSAFGLV